MNYFEEQLRLINNTLKLLPESEVNSGIKQELKRERDTILKELSPEDWRNL